MKNVDEKNIYGVTPLMMASLEGNIETVKTLIDRGADVDARNNYDVTALMWASEHGHIETVRVLLDKGADVNAENIDGRTALMWASQKGHKEITQLLRKAEGKNEKKLQGGKKMKKVIEKKEEKMKIDETIQFRVDGNNYSDWYTITRISEVKYGVSQQGQGDYETYETNRQHVDFLLSLKAK